jgi:hypothetical protein
MKNLIFSGPSGGSSGGEGSSKNSRRKKLKWHPAFIQAMQLELFEHKDSLDFRCEYQLTSEPLRIDLLIIKKPKELVIEKNIARIFRTDNIVEYKSPEDYLSVKDFLKVCAYANLYAAITPGVDLSEVTLTFVESRKPRKLLKYLESVRGYSVRETSPGIYSVGGDYLPIQIIVSKRLPESENLWLGSLRNDLKAENINAIMENRKRQMQDSGIDAYIDVVYEANRKTAEENDMSWLDSVAELMERKGLNSEWIEQGREEGLEQGREQAMATIARNLLAEGSTPQFVQKITGLSLEEIEKL